LPTILRDWREAERRLDSLPTDSRERAEVEVEVERLQLLYQAESTTRRDRGTE
jgi:hypothetical protein